MFLIDGKATAQAIRTELKEEILAIGAAASRPPQLTVILVGDDPASAVYVRNKERACAEVGIDSSTLRLPADTDSATLDGLIADLNADAGVDGILLQLPLPGGLDSKACLACIAPDKDVDGFHPVNMGNLALGHAGFQPCTPAGVMELLRRYDLSPSGKHAVVVGRSNIVGRPLSLMLGQSGPFANATVTVCHSRTRDLPAVTRQADFLFAAIGKPRFITADMVKEGAVVIDVGINRTEAGLCGDCDFDGLKGKVAAMTPVPGGVGPMTIAMLLRNAVTAWKAHLGLGARADHVRL